MSAPTSYVRRLPVYRLLQGIFLTILLLNTCAVVLAAETSKADKAGVTRYELAAALTRVVRGLEQSIPKLKEKSSKGSTAHFSDVPMRHWAEEDIEYLARLGIVTGNVDGTYRGEKTATRMEVLLILSRLASFAGKPLTETELTSEGFIKTDSPILTGKGTATIGEIADATASVASKLIAVVVPSLEDSEAQEEKSVNGQEKLK